MLPPSLFMGQLDLNHEKALSVTTCVSVLQKCRQRARKGNSCLQTDGKTRSTAKLSIRIRELGKINCDVEV